jgi:hypothetical protein
MERARYRLIQAGSTIARVDGPDNDRTFNEINHYAAVYGQDGPVRVERLERNRWVIWPPIEGKTEGIEA